MAFFLAGLPLIVCAQSDVAYELPPATAKQDIARHLQRAQAFMAAKNYASAKIEFEAVLRIDNLPEDLQQQLAIYTAIAEDYARGRPWSVTGYVMQGGGNYKVNATQGTDAFGRSDVDDAFVNTRLGGGLNVALSAGYAINTTLDYRYRDYAYSERERRDDKDLRWNTAVSRTLGESNLLLGVRGRTSYRGNGQYRHDYGLYGNARYILDEKKQLALGAEFRRRQYPQGSLRERSRNIAEINAAWSYALWDGKASLSLTARAGREIATNHRPDGDSNVIGFTPRLNVSLSENFGAYLFGWYERQRYHSARANVNAAGEVLSFERRRDHKYEAGAGLSWTFMPHWSLNPEVLYIYDDSNFLLAEYSSSEIWLLLRRDFQF